VAVALATAATATLLGGAGAPAGAQDDATIRFATEGDIGTLDPAVAYDGTSSEILHAVFDPLIEWDPDLVLQPVLATDLPDVSEGGTVITFHLRPGVWFVKDGQPFRELTADDVVYSLNRLLRPDLLPVPSPVGENFLGSVRGATDVVAGTTESASGIEAVDSLTVRITLDRPDRLLLDALTTTNASIVPVEAGLDSDAFAAEPIGTGAFWVETWEPGTGGTLRRNPVYWREGYPRADAVEIRLGVNAQTQFQQVKDGDLDLLGQAIIPIAEYPALVADPAMKDRILTGQSATLTYVSMDTSGPDSPFQDVRVRQAVNRAIDKANAIRLANGRAAQNDCIIPPIVPGFDPECHPYPRDVEKARALMADAGLEDGFDTTLVTSEGNLDQQVASSIATDLAQIGIRVTVEPQEWGTFFTTVSTPHAAPMAYGGAWGADYPDPAGFMEGLLTCDGAVEGGSNSSWWCDEAIDARIKDARQVTGLGEAAPLYTAIAADIMAQAPIVPMTSLTLDTLPSGRLTGFTKIDPAYFYDLKSYGIEQ
jgi:peptide/nickel transport system substrate-binding protein/oligopeptide transport system substrate-binding protein